MEEEDAKWIEIKDKGRPLLPFSLSKYEAINEKLHSPKEMYQDSIK